MLLSTVVNALIFKHVKTAIEDHELFIAVVNPWIIYNIAITVECFFSKSILPIVQFLTFKKYINLLWIYLLVFFENWGKTDTGS